MRTQSHSLAATAFGLILSASGLALGQTADVANPASAPSEAQLTEARDQYREGVAAFRARRFGDAVVAFERSFRIRPHPTTLYNEAEARFRAGDRDGAMVELRRVLAMTEPAPDQGTVEHVRALAHEAGVDDLQPAAPSGPSCPDAPVCPPQRECPVCPPPTVRPAAEHGPLPFILAGGGLALIATGMAFYGYSLGDAFAFNHPSNAQYPNPALDMALRDQGNAFRWVGFTTFILGLAAEGVAIYTYTHPSAPSAAAAHRRTPSFNPIAHVDVSPTGLMVTGTF